MRWTIEKAAREWGVSETTLARGIRRMALEVARGETYETPVIHRALTGEKHEAQARLAMAKAAMLEREERREAGELIDVQEMRSVIDAQFGPIRQAIVTAPAALCARVNPADPLLARTELERWRDTTLRLLSEKSVPVNGKPKKRGRGAPELRPQVRKR